MSQDLAQQVAELAAAVAKLAALVGTDTPVKEPKAARKASKIVKASANVDTAHRVRFVYSGAAVGTKVSYVGKVGGAAVMTKTAKGWDYDKK